MAEQDPSNPAAPPTQEVTPVQDAAPIAPPVAPAATFSEDDVNRIVSRRLAEAAENSRRERAEFMQAINERDQVLNEIRENQRRQTETQQFANLSPEEAAFARAAQAGAAGPSRAVAQRQDELLKAVSGMIAPVLARDEAADFLADKEAAIGTIPDSVKRATLTYLRQFKARGVTAEGAFRMAVSEHFDRQGFNAAPQPQTRTPAPAAPPVPVPHTEVGGARRSFVPSNPNAPKEYKAIRDSDGQVVKSGLRQLFEDHVATDPDSIEDAQAGGAGLTFDRKSGRVFAGPYRNPIG
jgi:hypothetical protein